MGTVKAEPETTAKTPVPIPQPHGGALVPGWKQAGPGVPKSKVRQACQEGAARNVDAIVAIVQDPSSSRSERVKAFEVLGRFGLGDLKEVVISSKQTLYQTCEVIAEWAHEHQIDHDKVMELTQRIMDRLGDQ